MSNALRFVRLDFVTIKPYFTWKNMVLIIAAPVMLLLVDGGSNLSIGFFMVFAAMYISYPFVIAERSGMDALYATLSIPRGTVVLGRYLFALVFDLLAGVLGVGLTMTVLFFTQKSLDRTEVLITSIVIMGVVTFVEAIQLPIYFKLGYEKAKMLATLPFIGVIAIGFAAGQLLPKLDDASQGFADVLLWLTTHQAVAAVIGGVIWLCIMMISYRASLRFYRKRDF